ncbi:MAG: DsbA family protein [Gammaproteobacteria bacterium]|nr:hypothetical protein [Gammaproteobacteria bacterium]
MAGEVKRLSSLVAWLIALQIFAIVATSAGGLYLYRDLERRIASVAARSGSEPSERVAGWQVLVRGHSPVLGNPDARVTIIEFSDFQCPFCKQFAATTRRELVAEHGDDLRFVFKHFPIERLHAEAVAAAVAAQCAARLGRFWEAYERFFEDPANLHTDALRAFGEELGLGAGYAECVSEAQTREEVELDIEDGLSIGVQGTPTFVINGRLVVGARPSTIREAVSAALAERAP